jgi:hypothetical protein
MLFDLAASQIEYFFRKMGVFGDWFLLVINFTVLWLSFGGLPSYRNQIFFQSVETKSDTIYTWLERWDYKLSGKAVFGISPTKNFNIFLSANFSLIKKKKKFRV